MPLGTLDRTPPPFFKQGPSALSKLIVFSAVALFLMVADLRFRVAQPVRAALATALYPVQWAVLQPVQLVGAAGGYVTSLHTAQQNEADAVRRLADQAARSLQVDQLMNENQRLRELLSMRERVKAGAIGAQVVYDAADPYSRRVVIDRGQTHGVVAGAPVIDESGVLGQVTRVYPLIAEVSLLVDRDQAIPVLDVRSGVRSVAYGQPASDGDGLELRYTLAETDIREGDLLTTSGVDAVYPPGLPVARVTTVERQSGSSFMRIRAEALARMDGALHVLVLEPAGAQLPPPPVAAPAADATQPGPVPGAKAAGRPGRQGARP
ncbi:MAG: rod shape-determining protein MreC [Hydrogenophaga sp. SCN 70-13]|uniref:rod shape-determining protein MreC n=1 Tax=unclassified Hydrogenophaga TaxID=2610897 RepID=UPI00086A2764|nr:MULTISPECIES: rod shape-determining protein MreC [unclassified Hydrogenophaga]MBN9370241.1 rod shape-determining protein MreC [Hydrogenophaga sp.]ODT31969.1 MAG: rod shape-determining protein MreC [Hydrogenophaga sp. SCN 70-13]OJV72160.1 MAG: rod shape-determining protein MreC [Hydrogenophaga sp. 70-12]